MLGRRPGRHHHAGTGRGRRRTVAWLTALAVPGTVVLAAVIWLAASPMAGATGAVRPAAPAAWASAASTLAISPPVAVPSTAGPSAAGASMVPMSPAQPGAGPVLTPSARRACPRAATACADLKDHLTWLQSHGRITYGPVRMEPGARKERTPRGIWHVAWKAGPHYISTSFGVPIPYAVFFAPGGIAFHAGSLTSSSHGCIHLRLRSARYFHNHLPEGAEVAVF
jgi:hypothetical protein